MVHVVEQVAGEVFIPLTVGGGIREVADIRRMLNAGADKVGDQYRRGLQSGIRAARPRQRFGSQCIVVAIDAKRTSGEHEPPAGRSTPTAAASRPASTPSSGRSAWSSYGAGEILLTSMDRDGTRDRFRPGADPRPYAMPSMCR